jgi:ATPase related to the helicase subunit of the Holliday junction resolvase
MEKPLAIKLAPTSLKEVIGQTHLIGKDKILSNLISNNKLPSIILYGRPGIGKTSIANAMVKDLGIRYRSLNATINNKQDFDIVVEEAKMYDGIVLVMDEIHRLNKDKQDLLLPQIESGLITLIGMTTSNPYHKINPAIRSRCHIFELMPLEIDDIIIGLKRAIKHPDLEGIDINKDTIKYIASIAGNDLRYAYNLLEAAFFSTKDKKVTLEVVKSINNKPAFFHDKNEDGHYDVLSAFQKSIRGSDVDAALHYLARLLEAGDLDSIYRRMTVICYEDIGLANPAMGPKVYAAIQAAELVGFPEAIIPLSEVIIELALSPKSNSSYLAINKALEDVRTGRCDKVPKHINSAAFGYKYPHDYPDNFVEQQYLPDNLINKKYYIPKATSQNERLLKEIREKLDKLRNNTKK